MLSLKTQTEPYTIPLPYDIMVTVKPLTTAGMAMAQAEAKRHIDRLISEAQELKQNGLPLGDLPDPDDEAAREGLYQDALIRVLGVRHITAWEGIGDDQDQPAPVTPENVAAVLALFPIGDRFYNEFTLHQVLLNAAKKGSGLSASGTSDRVEGPITVTPVPSKRRPARKAATA